MWRRTAAVSYKIDGGLIKTLTSSSPTPNPQRIKAPTVSQNHLRTQHLVPDPAMTAPGAEKVLNGGRFLARRKESKSKRFQTVFSTFWEKYRRRHRYFCRTSPSKPHLIHRPYAIRDRAKQRHAQGKEKNRRGRKTRLLV